MSSTYADQGTAAHKVLESCLTSIYSWGIPIEAREFVGSAITVEDGPHGDLSPSGAKRWMNCPGSVAVNAAHPEPDAPPREITFTEEDAVAVQECLDYIANRVQTLRAVTPEGEPVRVFTEAQTNPGYWFREDVDPARMRGTSDVRLVAGTFIEHIDYKHGAGVAVDVEDPQNQLYLLGSLAEHQAARDPLRGRHGDHRAAPLPRGVAPCAPS